MAGVGQVHSWPGALHEIGERPAERAIVRRERVEAFVPADGGLSLLGRAEEPMTLRTAATT